MVYNENVFMLSVLHSL